MKRVKLNPAMRLFRSSLGLFYFLLFLNPGLIGAKEIADSFQPAWWCRGGHCQTIFGSIFRADPSVPFERERVELPDGDFLDLDWVGKKDSALLLGILPGLGSSSKDRTVKNLAAEGVKAGFRVVVFNPRGGSGELNRLAKSHHGGRTDDLDFTLRQLIQKNPASEIYLTGYSLGGNVLLKWLGEQGGGVPGQVKKAAAVSVPYDLAKTSELLGRGFNRAVYTSNLLKNLKLHMLEKEKRFPGILDIEKVKRADTFEIYDREVTARLNGFKDEKDYWSQASSAAYLERIRIPVLLIHAANDPFLPAEFLPLEKIKTSGFFSVLITKDGGHLGFVSGSFPGKRTRWLEPVLFEFFKKVQDPA